MQHYHIERPLVGPAQQGSSGAVYRVIKVTDPARPVFVMKRLPSSPAADREVALLQQLDHPCLVRMIEHFDVSLPTAGAGAGVGRSKSTCLILEPLVHGDIAHVVAGLTSSAPLGESVVMNWWVQILLAVHYLHARGVVHGDLKLGNVFVDAQSEFVAIGDLGSASVPAGNASASAASGKWQDNAAGGTISMFSPERMNGAPASMASDVWALGVMLVEMANSASQQRDAHGNDAQLVARLCAGQVPALVGPGLSGAARLEMQRLAAWILDGKRPPAQRPSVEQVLRHDFVRRHVETFFRKLLTPPGARPIERSPLRYHQQQQQQRATDVSDRWHRFVAGQDPFNPHRLALVPTLETQMRVLLPTLFAEYSGGVPALQPHREREREQHQPPQLLRATMHDTMGTASELPLAATQHGHGAPMLEQQQQQQVLRGKSSGGGPSTLGFLMSQPETLAGAAPPRAKALSAELLQQQQHSLPAHRVSPYVPATNADLVPVIPTTNAVSLHRRAAADAGDGPLVVPPEHMSPESLRAYQRQQIPISAIRNQRTRAPFALTAETDNNSGNNYSNAGGHSRARSTSNAGGNSGGSAVNVSPLRGAGGGVSALAASPKGTSELISRLLRQ